MIVVIRPELAPLLVELLDVHLESGQRERVKAAALRAAAGALAAGLCLGRPARPGCASWRWHAAVNLARSSARPSVWGSVFLAFELS